MNSLPSRKYAGTVSTIAIAAAVITAQRCRTTNRTTGAYPAISQRLIGFFSSPRILPRMMIAASAGVSVTARIAAKPIEYVLVNASGLNSRPSVPSSVNTGMNDTVITSSEKKIDGPTSCIAAMITLVRSPGVLPVVELLVDVIDDDDRRVDHRADRDRDAAERHDVRGQPLEVQDRKSVV